jgi:cyclophilin family peptidyl-prolyl cis-trans isomerase
VICVHSRPFAANFPFCFRALPFQLITHIPTNWLEGKHTVFGQVTKGQDVVNATKQGDQLKSVTITES